MKNFRYLLFLFLFATLVVSFGFIHKTFAITADVTTLGGLSLDAYCNNLNQVNSNPINSSDWQCNPSGTKININNACQWQYNDPFAYGLQSKLSNPYTWQCFTSNSPPPTPKPTPIPTPSPETISKAIWIYDANNQKLGILLSFSPSQFYIPSINRIVFLENGQLSHYDMDYLSDDCSGQPYAADSVFKDMQEFSIHVLEILRPGKYYVIDANASPANLTLRSEHHYDTTTQVLTCLHINRTKFTMPLIPTTIPFTEPLKYPLSFKYQ